MMRNVNEADVDNCSPAPVATPNRNRTDGGPGNKTTS